MALTPPRWLKWPHGLRWPRRAPQGSRRASGEAAIDGYIARMESYAASVSWESEREAAIFEATGTVSPLRSEWVGVKTDCTVFTLQRYRERLRHLAARGDYHGPTKLVRLTRDGTWRPLPLPEIEI